MTTWKCDQPGCDKELTEDDTKYFTADGCWCEKCWLKEDEKYIEYPDYLDDIRDPARAARGLFYGVLLGVPFWLAACGIVALVKACTGGG